MGGDIGFDARITTDRTKRRGSGIESLARRWYTRHSKGVSRTPYKIMPVLIFLAFFGVACEKPAESHSRFVPRPVAVELATVEQEPIKDDLEFVGALAARESVRIHPEAEGVISAIEFEEGSRVIKDSVLFRLEDDEQRARFARVGGFARVGAA